MYKNKLKSFITHPLISFLILLPYVKPAPELTGSLDIIFDLIKLVFFPVIVWSYIKYAGKKPRLSLAVAALQLVFLISTLVSQGDIKSALMQFLSIMGCCMYVEVLIKIDCNLALKRIMVPLVIFAIVTSITMFATYPNGLYSVASRTRVETSNYYWGFDNSSVFKFFPAMLSLGLYAIVNKNKKQSLITLLLMVFFAASFFYVGSITASVCCAALTVVYVLINKKIIILNISYKQSIIAIIVVFILLAFLNNRLIYLYQFAMEYDKYYSIKARFIFWGRIFALFRESPLIGYGIEDKQIIISKLGIDHPHNYFMDLIYRSGVVGIFCAAYFLSFFIRIQNKKRNYGELFGASYLFLILFISQMDFYNEQFLFYPSLILCYYFSSYKKLDK